MMANLGFMHDAGATHYSLELVTMLTGLLMRLPAKMAAQVSQAMFYCTGGKSIGMDMHMEHLNKELKAMITRIGKPPEDIKHLTECVQTKACIVLYCVASSPTLW
jgi:hypothetical protein